MKKLATFASDIGVKAVLSCSVAILLTACGAGVSDTGIGQQVQTAAELTSNTSQGAAKGATIMPYGAEAAAAQEADAAAAPVADAAAAPATGAAAAQGANPAATQVADAGAAQATGTAAAQGANPASTPVADPAATQATGTAAAQTSEPTAGNSEPGTYDGNPASSGTAAAAPADGAPPVGVEPGGNPEQASLAQVPGNQ
jgi:hypothetical protein